MNARPNGPALGSPESGGVTECGGTSSCVPVLPSMSRMSLLYGPSGPIRSSGLIWNRGQVGQVQG